MLINEKFSLTEKKNSSNQLFSNFFSKTVTFTKFLQKKRCESKILTLLHFVEITEIYCHKVIFHFVNTVAVQYLNVPVGQQRLVQVEACGDPDEFSWRTVQLPKVD